MANNSEAALQAKIAGYVDILAKDPHSTIFVSLSDAYRQVGRLDEALDVARKGIEGLPWFSPGHVVLGQILMARGENSEALGCFNKALTLDGESIAAFKGLAAIYSQKGQPDIARQVLERAEQIHPDNSSIQHMLNQLSSTIKADPEPESVVPRTDDVQPADAPIATTTIAELFVKQGLLTQACQVYRDILQADPDNAQARVKLVELEGRLSDDSQVEEAAEQESLAAIAAETETESEPLATLQRWLTAIRLRREHVQKDFAGHR